MLQTIRVRVLGYLEKRGVIESRRQRVLIDDGSAANEPRVTETLGGPKVQPDRRFRQGCNALEKPKRRG